MIALTERLADVYGNAGSAEAEVLLIIATTCSMQMATTMVYGCDVRHLV